jgi:hypothetical protein
MKNIIYTVLVLLLFSCKGQTAYAQYSLSNLAPFIGIWEHRENDKIFRVTIFKDGGHLKGEYKLVEIANGIETILYKSDYFIPGTDFQWREAIFGGSEDGVKMGAHIVDNSINYENGLAHRKFKKGNLGFTIQPQTCINCPRYR